MCRLRGVFQVQVHGARFTGGHGDVAGQLLHARVVDALVLGHVHHAVIGGHEECSPRRGALRQTLQRRVQFLQLLQPFVTTHAVAVARRVNLAPVQVHGGRGAAGERLQGVGDAGVIADGIHEVAAAQRRLRQAGTAVLTQRNGEHAAVRMVAFQHGRQRLPGVRVHRLIPAGQVVHDRTRSPITSRVAHLVTGNAVRTGCRTGTQRGQGGGSRGGERSVQRAQVQCLTQGGRVAAVAVEQLLAQAVHHDHAGVAERRRINILLREATGKVQRVGNSVERRVRIQGVRGARQASLSHQRGSGLQHIGNAIAAVGGRGRQRRAQNIVQGGLYRHKVLSGVWRVCESTGHRAVCYCASATTGAYQWCLSAGCVHAGTVQSTRKMLRTLNRLRAVSGRRNTHRNVLAARIAGEAVVGVALRILAAGRSQLHVQRTGPGNLEGNLSRGGATGVVRLRLAETVADGDRVQGAQVHRLHAHMRHGALRVTFKVLVVQVRKDDVLTAEHHHGDVAVKIIAGEVGFMLYEVRVRVHARQRVIHHFQHEVGVETGMLNVCDQLLAFGGGGVHRTSFVRCPHEATSVGAHDEGG